MTSSKTQGQTKLLGFLGLLHLAVEERAVRNFQQESIKPRSVQMNCISIQKHSQQTERKQIQRTLRDKKYRLKIFLISTFQHRGEVALRIQKQKYDR